MKITTSFSYDRHTFLYLTIGVLVFLSGLYTVSISTSPIKVADCAGILLLMICIVYRRKLILNPLFIGFSLWLLWGVISFFLGKYFLKFPFVHTSEFASSFIRLPISLSMLIVIPTLLESMNKKRLIVLLRNIIILHCIIQLLFVVLTYTGNTHFFNIVLPGQIGRGEWFNIFYINKYTYRFGGIFEEPSWFGWYIILVYAIITGYEVWKKEKVLTFIHYVILILGLFFTFSFSAYASFICIFFTRLIIRPTLVSIILIAALSLGLLGSFIYATNNLKDHYYISRLERIQRGSDGSSNVRIIGSFNKTIAILTDYPYTGATIGNSDHLIEFISTRNYSDKYYTKHTLSNQIGFFEPFISTGIIGGFLFFIPFLFLSIERKYWLLLLGVCLVFFTMSSIFVVPFWLLFSIGVYVLSENQ